MRSSRQTQWLILLAVLAVATVFVARPPARTIVGEPDLRLALPARVGAYEGRDVLYCQNEQCQQRVLVSGGTPPVKCPACGGALSPISLGERRLLPADTIVVKKNYATALLPPISMSIVVSGSEQKSIHRPQQCLPAQGLMIEGSSVLNVPIEGRPHLRVTVLPVRRQGAAGSQRSDFAYWFVGNNRETESYAKQLLWTSLDRVVRRVNQRWAYVSILRSRAPGATEAQSREQLSRFIVDLYPSLQKEP
jgi:hypothetical protein